jgi:hypothetical protein
MFATQMEVSLIAMKDPDSNPAMDKSLKKIKQKLTRRSALKDSPHA